MNRKILILGVLIILQILFTGHILAAERDIKTDNKTMEKPKFICFVDENKDGINDLFHDADGDGINDVTNEKYNHRFRFLDKNKDKINDIFIDRDGDGVNDLETKFIDNNKDGINDNILDYDGDNINDITGLKYTKSDLKGYRYGIVEEEMKNLHKKFIDEDGDGMNDIVAKRRGLFKDNTHDRFVDDDNDGIGDGRRISRSGEKQNQGRTFRARNRNRRGKQ